MGKKIVDADKMDGITEAEILYVSIIHLSYEARVVLSIYCR